jgi:hypothetical protein
MTAARVGPITAIRRRACRSATASAANTPRHGTALTGRCLLCACLADVGAEVIEHPAQICFILRNLRQTEAGARQRVTVTKHPAALGHSMTSIRLTATPGCSGTSQANDNPRACLIRS